MMTEAGRLPPDLLLLRQSDVANHLALSRFQGAGHRLSGPGERQVPAGAAAIRDRCQGVGRNVDLEIVRSHDHFLAVDDFAPIDRDHVRLLPAPHPVGRGLVMTCWPYAGAEGCAHPVADERLPRIGGREKEKSGKGERLFYMSTLRIVRRERSSSKETEETR